MNAQHLTLVTSVKGKYIIFIHIVILIYTFNINSCNLYIACSCYCVIIILFLSLVCQSYNCNLLVINSCFTLFLIQSILVGRLSLLRRITTIRPFQRSKFLKTERIFILNVTYTHTHTHVLYNRGYTNRYESDRGGSFSLRRLERIKDRY